MTDCMDHLAFTNSTCPDCGESVDAYGNTEYQFDHCSFPDCGCDGERLCMAGEANDNAVNMNVEGMWRNDTSKRHKAIADLMELCSKDSAQNRQPR